MSKTADLTTPQRRWNHFDAALERWDRLHNERSDRVDMNGTVHNLTIEEYLDHVFPDWPLLVLRRDRQAAAAVLAFPDPADGYLVLPLVWDFEDRVGMRNLAFDSALNQSCMADSLPDLLDTLGTDSLGNPIEWADPERSAAEAVVSLIETKRQDGHRVLLGLAGYPGPLPDCHDDGLA